MRLRARFVIVIWLVLVLVPRSSSMLLALFWTMPVLLVPMLALMRLVAVMPLLVMVPVLFTALVVMLTELDALLAKAVGPPEVMTRFPVPVMPPETVSAALACGASV